MNIFFITTLVTAITCSLPAQASWCSKVFATSETKSSRGLTGGGRFGSLKVQYLMPDGSKITTRYDRTNRGLQHLSYRDRFGKKTLASLKDKTILDIGCGGGEFVTNLLELPQGKRPRQAIGIDARLPSWLENNPNFINANVIQMPFQNEYFDEIFSSASFFDYEQDELLLRKGMDESLRVLKPGGRILLYPAQLFTIFALKKIPGIRYRIRKNANVVIITKNP